MANRKTLLEYSASWWNSWRGSHDFHIRDRNHGPTLCHVFILNFNNAITYNFDLDFDPAFSAKELCTIDHWKKQKLWTCTSWGKLIFILKMSHFWWPQVNENPPLEKIQIIFRRKWKLSQNCTMCRRSTVTIWLCQQSYDWRKKNQFQYRKRMELQNSFFRSKKCRRFDLFDHPTLGEKNALFQFYSSLSSQKPYALNKRLPYNIIFIQIFIIWFVRKLQPCLSHTPVDRQKN